MFAKGGPQIYLNLLKNLVKAKAQVGNKDLVGAQVNNLKAAVITPKKLINLKTVPSK